MRMKETKKKTCLKELCMGNGRVLIP